MPAKAELSIFLVTDEAGKNKFIFARGKEIVGQTEGITPRLVYTALPEGVTSSGIDRIHEQLERIRKESGRNEIIPTQTETVDSHDLKREWQEGLSAMVTPQLNPILPPKPPEKVQKIWDTVTGIIVAFGLGKEVVASAGTTLILRSEARSLGKAESEAELEKKAQQVWQKLPEDEKARVLAHLGNVVGIDPSNVSFSDRLRMYNGIREASRQATEAQSKAIGVVSQNQENRVGSEVVKMSLDKINNLVSAGLGTLEVGTKAFVGTPFSVIAGIADGISEALSIHPLSGVVSGVGILGGSSLLFTRAINVVSEHLLTSDVLSLVKDLGIMYCLIILGTTGVSTIWKSITRSKEPTITR